eukprot:CAMPEP_0113391304 /NCGR_PEP_ID=MMETSP0013_2-20120614/10638_1 /TAXON_ID=2843 ORGANISM="Skeletonema costatum, Strain 1716" /NCGR_SAMPLE_ID=MMETSP0013_2 /ASSEMBLY_ACC=CAM_ASM_000158 /LENGTH=461 /DNA_ID=CAMNT_0000274537 /DNA_START=88 /DNA_END=1473 /DNA_ORIENTATION=- /assembly_acc=CAM_ASM_000158
MMIRRTTTTPTFLVAMMLLASTMRSSHAFQLAHKNSPLLVPNHITMPSKKIFAAPANNHLNLLGPQPFDGQRSAVTTATMLRASSINDDENDADENTNNKQVIQNLASSMKQFLSTHFMTIAIFLLPLFLSANDAWAVQSGGRMGGSFGGSSSRSSSSRSYSAPSSGYSRGYGRGYSSGYYSRPNVIVAPGISPFYSPFRNPFYTPYYYGSPGGVVVSRGPGFGSILIFAVFALVAFSAVANIGSSVGDSIGSAVGSNVQSVLGSGVSAVEISVALNVADRDSPNSILSALNRLSRTARTDSRVGLQNLTSQVALELLRRKEDIVAASTSGQNFKDESKAQREFNNMSIRERSKFQRETVSNYGGVDYSAGEMKRANEYSPKATVAVVTLVMLIEGDSTSKKLSKRVNSIRDVEDALSRVAADSKADKCLQGAEILWTPEERDETLTMRDVLADYSSLRTV